MTLLQLASVVVMGTLIAIFGLLYWHESRRPEVRRRHEATGQFDPTAAAARQGHRDVGGGTTDS